MSRCIRIAVTVALVVRLSVGVAFGATAGADVEGYVLSVEGGDVIVDIGAVRGASVNDVVELWRPIDLVHPVTKQHIKDRYRIGHLKLVQVRERMAVAVVEDAKLAPEPGDFVVWRRKVSEPPPTLAANGPRARPAPASSAAEAAPPSSPPSPGGAAAPSGRAPAGAVSDAESQKVSALFDSLREAPLLDRIRAYLAYAKKNPASPFARVLHDDAAELYRLLRVQEASESAGSGHSASAAANGAGVRVDFEPPAYAVGGRDLDLGLRVGAPFVGAVLHVRRRGAVGYTSTAMVRSGDGYFRSTIPAANMLPPRTEYFVEGVDAEGRAAPIVGADDQPLTIEIERRPNAEPPTLQKRTTASLLTDWADFNRLRSDRPDRTWQTEGLLGMRFDDVGIRAVRTGFGVYRGVSGSLEELDALANPRVRNVGLTYGYLEGEFGIVHSASIIARVVAGLTEAGTASGALAMVRIGNDLETNLSLGFEVLGGVGIRSITELELHPAPRFPLLLRSEVTNQPAGVSDPNEPGPPELRGALGLRGIVQPGYEVWPGLVLALRLSYQGRTIYHAGPGFGGAVSYSW